jgi:transposase
MKKASIYIPYAFRCFQGFTVSDIKEFQIKKHMEIHLVKEDDRKHLCCRCGGELGSQDGRYYVKARHLRIFNWTVSVCFWREKRHCTNCKKVRSELVEWLCPTSPHITLELGWWINRMSEITSVNQVSKLESVDKMACYKVDKYILQRLLQGYEIPKVTKISVDEVYARGPKQKKKGETRDDLFLTVIVDIRTRKAIWVSKSRRKEALDEFFKIIGPAGCEEIKVVATDQHEGYSASVKEFCPNAKVVWDRFHLVQNFNDAINEERKSELENIDPEGDMGDLMNGKYRYIFLTKSKNRKSKDQRHINEVMRLNTKMGQLEIIKEHFHQMFDCDDRESAQVMLCECYEWAWQAKAMQVVKWIWSVMDDERFWNYFEYKVTTGLSEGINRAIKGLKWQAFGYKDMLYFSLKILQKVGYLNHRYILSQT